MRHAVKRIFVLESKRINMKSTFTFVLAAVGTVTAHGGYPPINQYGQPQVGYLYQQPMFLPPVQPGAQLLMKEEKRDDFQGNCLRVASISAVEINAALLKCQRGSSIDG